MIIDLPNPAFIDQTPVFVNRAGIPDNSIEYMWKSHIWPNPGSDSRSAALEDEIEFFARMPHNWDGYGSLPIHIETKMNSLEALSNLLRSAPPPDITPNSNGTLSFEWETSSGVANLEVGKSKLSFYMKTSDADPTFIDSQTESAGSVYLRIGSMVSSMLYGANPPMRPITHISMVADVLRSH